MVEVNEWNRGVIEEFRANKGKVGGVYEGAPMLLLHTTGARTGGQRVNPLVYLPDGDDFVVFASKAGAPSNPDWYYNLLANPRASIEVGDASLDVVARVVDGDVRERLWTRQVERFSRFAEYQRKIERKIPVIVLEVVQP
ncbi:MAG TPA: nitroreductase family deazaflavin-dependent oxidoreductase [Ilumatobacteraceae bacterium]|nr:nitroreductase family deazaflavin-dependent oxidoreductase [Ilumatobacteraceae bacterium]